MKCCSRGFSCQSTTLAARHKYSLSRGVKNGADLVPAYLLRQVLVRRAAVRAPDADLVFNARGCQVGQAGVCRNRVYDVLVSLECADDGSCPGIPYVHPAIVTACKSITDSFHSLLGLGESN